MELRSLKLRDFRSYGQAEAVLSPGVNILVGDNGQGKTNLLEAVYLLSGARSFRTPRRRELIAFGAESARIEADCTGRGREFHIKMEIGQGRTGIWVNNVKLKRQFDLSDSLRCVLFSPEDLYLIKGAPAGRRDFLDEALCQLRPRYGEILAGYDRLLSQKSALLKSLEERPQMESVLPAINTQLCEHGARIIAYRHNLICALDRVCPELHREISGGKETLKLGYKTVSAVTDPGAGFAAVYGQLWDHMEAHYGAEKATCSCLSGPHKDDLEVEICGKSAKSYASQGQTRTAALALKFGLRELLKEDCGEYPLLLLDDVLSELDEGRQQFICDNTLGGQTLITCCSEQSPLRRSGAALFKVADRSVKRCEVIENSEE